MVWFTAFASHVSNWLSALLIVFFFRVVSDYLSSFLTERHIAVNSSHHLLDGDTVKLHEFHSVCVVYM